MKYAALLCSLLALTLLPVSAADNRTRRLKELKEMLDAGVITQSDYQDYKDKIILGNMAGTGNQTTESVSDIAWACNFAGDPFRGKSTAFLTSFETSASAPAASISSSTPSGAREKAGARPRTSAIAGCWSASDTGGNVHVRGTSEVAATWPS